MNHPLHLDSGLARAGQLRAEAAQARLARQLQAPSLLARLLARWRRDSARPVRAAKASGRALGR